MVASTDQHATGNVHISNYKKALLSMFDRKKAWRYLNKQREEHQKHKELKKTFLSDQVIYH